MRIHPIKGFIINRSGPAKKFQQKTMDTIDKTIKTTLKTLISRTEVEVPPKDFFRTIEEKFKNPDIASLAHEIKFSIKPSTEKNNRIGRILKMQIFSLKGNSISPIFECGNKEEILKFLKDEHLSEKIKTFIAEATDVMLKKNLD